MSNNLLVYDTETTGMPDWKNPSDGEQQPHIVQLAACLVDADSREFLESMDVIVYPKTWDIPQETVEVHGITTERARDEGIDEAAALDQFLSMWAKSDKRVAHNESFDARIIRIGTMRYSNDQIIDGWSQGKENAICTARLATPILQLPPTDRMRAARRFHFKTPNLSEAYKFFTGQDLENAHNAMADVMACMAVYFGCVDHQEKEQANG